MTDDRVDGRTLRYRHRRPELLAAATEYVLDHGIDGVSLRPVATALGVSHATLLRHFKSKDELLLCVGDKIRGDFVRSWQQDEQFSTASSSAELVRMVWTRLCEPREQRQFILLFQLVGRAARRPADAQALAPSIVDDWLTPIEERLCADGWPADEARTLATLVLGHIRGLQLDLLLTGDRARVDAAFDAAIAMMHSPHGS
ncbi:TetR family transcriptional regulator [Nocardia mangyaensis]|uniref:TetR family transcriptional regulator n=1 Tax=Nocardia mangyaensis TaxID=2213200 RepID=A0A1J0VPN3_9NOCA|nr:TetR/AcrR family transcriptional regulator [Nocardia mangyaensis]APE33935.1 TetR family transcriptional regulator [Nocardia mangyaensis]